MLSTSQKRFLKDLFPGEQCLLDPEPCLVFGTDASRRFARPWAVVRPLDTQQVAGLLAWAEQERVPLVPRARATNVVGDCVPVAGGVVLSLLAMNRILDIDDRDFVAVVEPGVISGDLQAAVEKKGLFYPPDPASVKISTVGGNVSTNAGGMRAVKYGVTRDYVLGLEAVLPGGETVRTGGRVHKDAVGLDLTGLLVGSEGTLAVITRITLKLLPKPRATASLLVGYSSLEDCLQGAASVFRAGLLPVAMELMDSAVLDCLAGFREVPWSPETRAALLFKLDGSPAALAADLDRLERAVQEAGPCFLERGEAPDSEERLWELRRLINPASYRVRPDKLSQDVTLPRGRVGEALLEIRRIGRDTGLLVLTFGHLGDGNIHVNVMHDASLPTEKDKAAAAMDKVMRLAIAQGGTLSGEHGVGLSKLEYLDLQLGRKERQLMRAVKQAFDPHGIMNPGKAY